MCISLCACMQLLVKGSVSSALQALPVTRLVACMRPNAQPAGMQWNLKQAPRGLRSSCCNSCFQPSFSMTQDCIRRWISCSRWTCARLRSCWATCSTASYAEPGLQVFILASSAFNLAFASRRAVPDAGPGAGGGPAPGRAAAGLRALRLQPGGAGGGASGGRPPVCAAAGPYTPAGRRRYRPLPSMLAPFVFVFDV